MSLIDLLPSVQALPGADKLRLMQFLAGDLVCEEGVLPVELPPTCPIWTPFDAHDAAKVLMQTLEEDSVT